MNKWATISTTSEKVHYPPKITKLHMKWCKQGHIVICDLLEDRDCIKGEWVKNY